MLFKRDTGADKYFFEVKKGELPKRLHMNIISNINPEATSNIAKDAKKNRRSEDSIN